LAYVGYYCLSAGASLASGEEVMTLTMHLHYSILTVILILPSGRGISFSAGTGRSTLAASEQ